MTPKLKAKTLINEMYNIREMDWEMAVNCALIAVDEILKQCYDYRDIDLQASYDYWQEVKTEINKL